MPENGGLPQNQIESRKQMTRRRRMNRFRRHDDRRQKGGPVWHLMGPSFETELTLIEIFELFDAGTDCEHVAYVQFAILSHHGNEIFCFKFHTMLYTVLFMSHTMEK
ncbi:hypothetical protein MUK42_35334 [Musa troglodytarum]|uniref:Uncharacterized protein n=1 Tax=Musa troglodytarum TaxID=320322 RepID=A0A9E7ECE3_9LILI|nr:hypothetical protein MUK42_35334 [Musa troglodytarum]